METTKRKLEELISAADKIIEANSKPQENLFGEVKDPNKIRELLDLPLQDPQKSYELYYPNIRKFLDKYIPKDLDIREVIFEEVNIMLAHKERIGITCGKRNADSRMSSTKDMEYLIDVLSEWAETPTDYFKLAHILLKKNQELGYVPKERVLRDYMKQRKK